MIHKFVCFALGCFLLWGCSRSEETVLIGAASSFQIPLLELEPLIEKETRCSISWTFNASGILAEQIRQGARIDLFISAAPDYIQRLVQDGFINPDWICPLVTGKLILLVRKGLTIDNLVDLGSSHVRSVAIANPLYAPYGKMAREALEKSGIISQIRDKLVLLPSVRKATLLVLEGQVDVALTAASLVKPGDITLSIPPKLYTPVNHVLALTRYADQKPHAVQLYHYLCSDSFRSKLYEHGFQPPPP